MVEGKMKEVIDGTLVPLVELKNVTDWSSVKKVCVLDFFTVQLLFTHFPLKYHKLNDEAAVKGSKELEIIDNIVISSVATKSVMS